MEPIKEVNCERVYDAPIDLIWQACTVPQKLALWWGPNGVSIPECEVDLRVGGKIRIVMEAGEAMGPYKGTKWLMLGEFTIVEPKSQLTYTAKAWTDGQDEETQIDQITELSLVEQDGKAKLHLRAVVNKIGPAAQMAVQGIEAGFAQQLDKLNDCLPALELLSKGIFGIIVWMISQMLGLVAGWLGIWGISQIFGLVVAALAIAWAMRCFG